MEEMVKQGFLRARVNGKMVDLESPPDLDKQKKHTIEVVVDRLVVRRDDETRRRLADSLETATRVGKGLVTIATLGANAGRADVRRDAFDELRLPRLRDVAHRDHAAPLLLQLAVRRVPLVQRPRDGAEGGSGAARSRPVEIDPRRGDRALQAGLGELAAPADRAPREGAEVLARRAVQEARRRTSRTSSSTARASARSSGSGSPRRASTTGRRPSRASCRSSRASTRRSRARRPAPSSRTTCRPRPARRARAAA